MNKILGKLLNTNAQKHLKIKKIIKTEKNQKQLKHNMPNKHKKKSKKRKKTKITQKYISTKKINRKKLKYINTINFKKHTSIQIMLQTIKKKNKCTKN